MPSLIAIAAPGGPLFLDELSAAWDRGDAVLPIDTRLPLAAVQRLVAALQPAVLVDEAGSRVHLPDGRPVEEGDALVMATSGTTGEPKGVVLTHDAVRASAGATSARLAVDPARDKWLACLPVAHIGGLSVITRALVTNTPLQVAPAYDPLTDATLVSVVPTILERNDTSRFRVVVVGGSSDWRRRGGNVVHTYGLTETGSGVVYDGVPLDGVDVRIDDRGEIHLRGPMLLRCYRDGRDPKDEQGWLPTGDAGEWHDGRLTVHGRIGDCIVSGGEKVWPGPVESAIRTLDAVEDVAVVGVPDPEWGHRVTAFVVGRPNGSPPTLDEVREAVKATLPAYMAPKELRLVADLPRTALGKVRRNLLVDSR